MAVNVKVQLFHTPEWGTTRSWLLTWKYSFIPWGWGTTRSWLLTWLSNAKRKARTSRTHPVHIRSLSQSVVLCFPCVSALAHHAHFTVVFYPVIRLQAYPSTCRAYWGWCPVFLRLSEPNTLIQWPRQRLLTYIPVSIVCNFVSDS